MTGESSHASHYKHCLTRLQLKECLTNNSLSDVRHVNVMFWPRQRRRTTWPTRTHTHTHTHTHTSDVIAHAYSFVFYKSTKLHNETLHSNQFGNCAMYFCNRKKNTVEKAKSSKPLHGRTWDRKLIHGDWWRHCDVTVCTCLNTVYNNNWTQAHYHDTVCTSHCVYDTVYDSICWQQAQISFQLVEMWI